MRKQGANRKEATPTDPKKARKQWKPLPGTKKEQTRERNHPATKPEGREDTMKTETFAQLEFTPNDPALKYSENPEALKKLMEEVKVSYKSKGKGLYFDDDKEERETLIVKVTRETRTIQFSFGMSINDTAILYPRNFLMAHAGDRKDKQENEKEKARIFAGLLYSLLTCMRSEHYCPKSFSDFCSEYGYDEDSRKAEKTHRACLEQSARLEKIFSEDEIQALPN